MKHNIILWTVIILILTSVSFAGEANHELTSVSRIVGNSPADMISQLRRSNIGLDEAELFSPGYQVSNVVEKKFDSSNTNSHSKWTFDDVKKQLQNNKDTLVNIQSISTKATPYSLPNGKSSDIAQWNLADDNVFFLDAQYAGLHIPGTLSFASKISAKDTLIAPLSYKSWLFGKALMCNIGKYSSIGQDFLNARNNYYLNTQTNNDFLGLTLLSYALYGPSTVKASTPKLTDALCSDYTKYQYQSEDEFSISAVAPGTYTKTITLKLPDPTINSYGDYSLIETDQSLPRMMTEELMLPIMSELTMFPFKTVVRNVTAVSFSDPEDLTVGALPMWNGDMQDRICFSDKAQPSIDFSHTFSERAELVVANINPTEVVDCSKGTFKFYKTVKYAIEYIPYSPLLIRDVSYSDPLLPEQAAKVNVTLENLETTPANGTLVLFLDGNAEATNILTATKSTFSLDFMTPSEEGTYTYRLEFFEANESKTFTEFTTGVTVLDATLSIPDIVTNRADLTLTLVNHLNSTINTVVEDFLSANGSLIASNSQTLHLSPGVTTHTISYTNLDHKQSHYDVLVDIPYLSKNKVLTGTIITNHPPVIDQGNIVLNEGDAITLVPTATDIDGDTVTITTDAPFKLDGSHTFGFEDSGEYSITITADDGITSIEKKISVLVENTNRAPVLTVPDTINAEEGETVVISPTAIDPDNQNNVDNDDNELIFAYGEPFDENGEWTPDYDSAGEFTVDVTVSDGELIDTKTITVIVNNKNRAPSLDALTDVTVNEGELVDLLKGYDPDNVNIDVSDDNIAHHSFDGPFDHYGKWQTTYDDAGVYEVTVSMTDYQSTVGKKIIVTVENVNRPPEINAPDVVEGVGTIDLSHYVSDPDNTNTVDNDDTPVTVTYSSPFDKNGLWTVTQTSTALVTITVSDGEFTTTKDVLVFGEPDEVPEIPEETPDVPEEPSAPEPPLPPPPALPAQPEEQPESTPTTGSPPALIQETPVDDLEVIIKANGKTLDDGDSIHVDPDDELTVKVELDNRGTEDKDVDVDVDIDIDDEDDDLTVKAGDIERLTFDFDIPRLTDDDAYPFDVFVTDNEKQREWNFKLKIDKPAHELQFRYLTVTPERVQCADDTAEVRVKLENTGRHDEEGILSIDDRTIGFSIEQGASRIFTEKLYRLEAGAHTLPVTASYGRNELSKTAAFTVDACTAETTAVTKAVPEEAPVLAPILAATAIKHEAEPILPELLNTTFLALATLFTVLFIFTVFTYK